MLRLVMGQLGLSLDDGTRLFLPVPQALPPDTIGSGDESHR